MSDDRAAEITGAFLSNAVRAILPTRIAKMSPGPESPIERMLLIGIMGFAYLFPRYVFGGERMHLGEAPEFPEMHLTCQAAVLQYRADFLIEVHYEGSIIGKVVVECDGHDFHERTKEQAARDRTRDREMTLAGYRVMRFTGSEIFGNLENCVNDVHKACISFYDAVVARG